MGNIIVLDELTINKIAAGEVIERPANVVKELVENAIDAGAENILIEIKNGGKTYIKVMDNGKGISSEEMPIALERHATSKIKKIEDLERTYTMGFRGEALASITAISKLTMISKTKEELLGSKVIAKAGEITEIEEVGVPVGTTIVIEDLFFNTPVRYKFLKQDVTEFKYIKDWVQKTALANLDISFKLINDEKVVFTSTGNGNMQDLVYMLYGSETKENLIEVDYQEKDIKVTGVIGNTLMARENRKNQILFLNKRNIKDQILTSSADQAFKGATGIGKFGFYILNVEMPANCYDVNVHPTKKEVRFKENEKIYRIFYHAIKNAMLDKTFLGNHEKEEKERYVENEYAFLTNHFEKTKEEGCKEEKTNTKNTEETLIHRENKRRIEYTYIGILFRTYILIEIGEELFLIDQHAAHERILYEQIKENYKKHMQNNSQMMLIPEVVQLTHKEIAFVQEHEELFKKVGFDIETFGENTIKINAIPDIEYKVNRRDIFLEILDEMLTSQRSSLKDVEERFIATVACKAAVKANMDLSEKEVDYLIQNLLQLQNPYTCPHGRPTTIKIKKEELVK